jgi:DNA-directed RNA polymerase subunit RPC12/RpoP
MTTLVRACLECGRPIHSGMRCDECGKTNARGYDAAWKHLVAAAIAAQPWCTDCSQEAGDPDNPLSGDHLRWPATSLDDIDVVCRRCNSRRGPRRGTYRKAPENFEVDQPATRPVRAPNRSRRSSGVVIA